MLLNNNLVEVHSVKY